MFVLCLALAACAGGEQRSETTEPSPVRAYAADNQVELYGRHRCPICRNFAAQLKAKNIEYQFYEIDREPERAREMWALLGEHFPDAKSIGLPVVYVNGTLLLRPGFAQFESYLKAAR